MPAIDRKRSWQTGMDGMIAVIGAGAWGTALAVLAAERNPAVTLWAREPEVVQSVLERRENSLFLPGIMLPANIQPTSDLAASVARAELVLLVVPAQHLRTTLRHLAPFLPPRAALVICAKGIEAATGALMTDLMAQEVPNHSYAVLSGPTFAAEVAAGLPAAVMAASTHPGLVDSIATRLGTARFRVYRSDDPVGAAVGGAVKNVIAIGCGIASGRGLGDNARAALITRGLYEMSRFAEALGGRAETLAGLAGLGDLVLTCCSEQSRNFSFGLALGRGASFAALMAGRLTVAEGVATAAAVLRRAQPLAVEMPIVTAVDAVLNRGETLDAAIAALLARPVGQD